MFNYWVLELCLFGCVLENVSVCLFYVCSLKQHLLCFGRVYCTVFFQWVTLNVLRLWLILLCVSNQRELLDMDIAYAVLQQVSMPVQNQIEIFTKKWMLIHRKIFYSHLYCLFCIIWSFTKCQVYDNLLVPVFGFSSYPFCLCSLYHLTSVHFSSFCCMQIFWNLYG